MLHYTFQPFEVSVTLVEKGVSGRGGKGSACYANATVSAVRGTHPSDTSFLIAGAGESVYALHDCVAQQEWQSQAHEDGQSEHLSLG